MDQQDGGSAIVEAVSSLEEAMGGITRILTLHGHMLAELLALAREKPPEESELEMLLKALIGRLDQQSGTLNRIEKGIEAFNAMLAKANVAS